MDKLLVRIAEENDVGVLNELAADEARRLGVVAASTHISAPHASQVGKSVFIAMFGFSPEWTSLYRKPEFRANDPIPDFVMREGKSTSYREVLAQLQLTTAQEDYVAQMEAQGLIETMAIPIYGPYDFDTYCTFNIGREVRPEDTELLHHLIAMMEIANRRMAQLLEKQSGNLVPLSDRELEVLNWIGRSKSNGDIATILGVSSATVDTYVRRIFAKLETNDRVAAVIKGLRLGLIRF